MGLMQRTTIKPKPKKQAPKTTEPKKDGGDNGSGKSDRSKGSAKV